jgi:AbrB family looped-hinge helix DNA binding protein
MSQTISVKVSSRYQIAVPPTARRQLKIQRGDRLLVDIQDNMIVLIPAPQDYAAQLAGLHREIWQSVDIQAYLSEERDAWKASSNG